MNHVIVGAIEVLQQGRAMISAITPEQYQQPMRKPFPASVGQHYRHILEHFVCFLQGMGTGLIDYDKRERNLRLETERAYALQVTDFLIEAVSSISEAQVHAACAALYSVSYTAAANPIASSVERELAYCVSHAVHHFALMRLICADAAIEVGGVSGIAPSTLQSRAGAATA